MTRSIDQSLQSFGKHTCQLFHVNSNIDYPISLLGSAIRVKFKDKYLVLCTRHQLKFTDDHSKFGILSTNDIVCTSGGIRYFSEGNEIELKDLCALDYTLPVHEYPELRETFFDFTDRPPNITFAELGLPAAFGFPSKLQHYDPEGRRITSRRVTVLCLTASKSNDESIYTYRTMNDLDFDPDGLSGGAMFIPHITKKGVKIYFAGMITRAGNRSITVINSGSIYHCLDKIFHPSAA